MQCWQRAAAAGFRIPEIPRENLNKTFPGTECRVLDGKLVAALLHDQCRELAAGRTRPKLAAVLAGEDPASQVYVGSKAKTFASVGFDSITIRMTSEESSDSKLLETVDSLNASSDIHGILVQLPLPRGVDAARITGRIAPEKDVDGFLASSMGQLATGEWTGFLPCTPFGVMVMLAAYGISLKGKRVVVVGRSNIVGKPMALLALSADATVTIAHSRTDNLEAVCREADILVAAAGKPALLTRRHVRPGAVVVDVGIHRSSEGKLCGDVHPEVAEVASAMTPVPGGVGPLTIAMLCVNTALAAWVAPGS